MYYEVAKRKNNGERWNVTVINLEENDLMQKLM